ncbi:MAG: OmpA family protein [Bacteroidia bacterium]|nr:OmpA family protein [Bacteroidia bacterium]
MIRHLALVSNLFLYCVLNAQLLNRFTLNFKSNAYVLTQAHTQTLDSFINSLPNRPEGYAIEIKGHTDNKGSLDHNTTLSKNRAYSVLSYMKSKHFVTSDTSIKFYAYTQPLLPNSEDNLWKNRRVEICLYARKLDMVKILGIHDFKPKRYKLNEDLGGTVTYDSTTIVIAANSFLHQNGNEVSGEIDLVYTEYRKPSDFLLSGIPMSIQSGDQLKHFNSGGMFNIAAFQNDLPLVLKKENDKKIRIQFPLSNILEQDFYTFDTVAGTWNTKTASISDSHGNVLAPFNLAGQGNDSSDDASWKFNLCVPTGDTCSYVFSMLNKLKYYLKHEEPIRYNCPYKFIKNYLVDFKSPFYAINFNKENNTLTLVPQNKHNRLDAFTNYIWKFNPKDLERPLKHNFEQGASFVKITNRNSIKFKLIIESETLTVTGEPADFRDKKLSKKPIFAFMYGGKEKAMESKLKKLNRKNYKNYLAHSKEFDNYETLLESELRDLDGNYTGMIGKDYGKDSMDCLGNFYRNYLFTEDEKTLLSLNDFNMNKAKLAAKLNALPSPFTCKDIDRLLFRKDSIAANVLSARKLNLSKTQQKFAEFGINANGIYNVDQIKNINEPVEIFAEYKTEANQPLKIISVYISIKGLNGIINYNGSMNYGPNRFVYGKLDETMLIAVDRNEKSYYCTPQEFAAYVNSKEGKRVSFILKPLSKLESAGNLQKIVAN